MLRRNFLVTLALSPWVVGIARARSAPAPYWRRELLDSESVPTSLGQLAAGQRLVVVVMKGHWCDVCVDQLVRIAERRTELSRLGARCVGLNVDSPRENAKVREKVRLAFPIVSDPEHRVVEAMRLWRADWGHPVPAIVVYDECGTERGRLVGRRPGERAEAALFSLLEKIAKAPGKCPGESRASA